MTSRRLFLRIMQKKSYTVALNVTGVGVVRLEDFGSGRG